MDKNTNRDKSKLRKGLSRDVKALFKAFLNILETDLNSRLSSFVEEHGEIDGDCLSVFKDDYEKKRKLVLDYGNDCIRAIDNRLEDYDVDYNPGVNLKQRKGDDDGKGE